MTVIGIVGCEARKFTPHTEAQARHWIRQLCARADQIVSGRSPLGGIDWWAIEEARALGTAWDEFPATTNTWAGPDGFMARNLAIARASDLVVCISVLELPADYRGRRFAQGCYHCARHGVDPHGHVKSGGCWTRWEAEALGKRGELLVAR